MEIDSWIKSRSTISPEQLHALGVVTFNYNTAETTLFWLFCQVTRLGGRIARVMVHDLQAPAICLRIDDSLEVAKWPDDVNDAIRHATKLFDMNRMNRNQLTHFMPTGSSEGIEFWRNKGPKIEREVVPNDLSDLRRVADDLHTLSDYLGKLGNWLSARNYSDPLLETWRSIPLPDKPPLPERLWKPPPQVRSKRQHPPPPSPE